MDNSNLAIRMKDYESRNRYYLQKKIPVALHLGMRAGHTFTKGFGKPFDHTFMLAMQETTQRLCENIQGACLAYVQSDEITLILQDYKTIDTDAFFDYRTDKLCSIVASMATLYFNRSFERLYLEELGCWDLEAKDLPNFVLAHDLARKRGATFDCRCFNIPLDEVTNLIYWRQLDATRNSIQSTGQIYFSHKELDGKSCNNIQEKGINWNDMSVAEKRGTCCVKQGNKWVIDLNIPIFRNDGRQYIESRIRFE